MFCLSLISKLLSGCSVIPAWVPSLVPRPGQTGFDCQQEQLDAPTSALFAGYKEHREMLQAKILTTLTIVPADTFQMILWEPALHECE